MSAAALRALHVPGDPLILPNAWDAATARAVAAAGFPAVATTSSGVAESLGYEDGERDPGGRDARRGRADRARGRRSGHRRPRGRLRARSRRPRAAAVAAGAVGLNFEDTDHANAPRLHAIGAQAARIAALKAAQDLVVNARIDVHLHGGPVAEGARARAGVPRRGRRLRLPDRDHRRGDDRRVRRARHAGQRPPARRPRRRSSGWPSSASPASASATSSTPRCSPRWTSGSPASAAAVRVRDRHPPVAAERARRDLDPRRRLAALVLGPVDEREHALDRLARAARRARAARGPRPPRCRPRGSRRACRSRAASPRPSGPAAARRSAAGR